MILHAIAWLSIIGMIVSSMAATAMAYAFGRNDDGTHSASVYIFGTVTLVLMWAAYESFPFKFGGA